MRTAAQLYNLQLVDLELDARQERLRQIEERLCETEALVQTREAAKVAEKEATSLEKRLRELEWEAAALEEKRRPLERKLYGGTVRNPKELVGMQEELDIFQGKARKLEDEELEQMVALDEARLAANKAREGYAALEAEWRAEQEKLLAERESLVSEMADLRQGRDALAQTLPRRDIDTYQQLRSQKGGLAVSKVERGLCLGCRISLPSSELQAARVNPEPVFCSSCGRILFAS